MAFYKRPRPRPKKRINVNPNFGLREVLHGTVSFRDGVGHINVISGSLYIPPGVITVKIDGLRRDRRVLVDVGGCQRVVRTHVHTRLYMEGKGGLLKLKGEPDAGTITILHHRGAGTSLDDTTLQTSTISL